MTPFMLSLAYVLTVAGLCGATALAAAAAALAGA